MVKYSTFNKRCPRCSNIMKYKEERRAVRDRENDHARKCGLCNYEEA